MLANWPRQHTRWWRAKSIITIALNMVFFILLTVRVRSGWTERLEISINVKEFPYNFKFFKI